MSTEDHRVCPLLPPSKRARFTSPGMEPLLVPLRPSNVHILIVRVPGARDISRGIIPPLPSASKKDGLGEIDCQSDWLHYL